MNKPMSPEAITKLRTAIAESRFEDYPWWKELRDAKNVRLDGISLFEESVVPLDDDRFQMAVNLYVQPRNARGVDLGRSEVLSGMLTFKSDDGGVGIEALQFDTSSIVPRPPQKDSARTYVHIAAKRKNIPTAENQGLVPDEEKEVKTLRYPRNVDLDPQLVWRGKDQENDRDLEVQAPPIYIQEKIHPRVLIEELKRRSNRPSEPQIDLFHDFNGLPDAEARTEFYAHDQNWSNRMILGDSLLVMGSLAERERLRGQVQTIYFDPPYGIKFNSNWQPSTKNRDVRDGKVESVSREPEVVKAFRDTWEDKIHSYLSYLRDRLTAAYDLLADSGSIFVQIGDDNVHLARSVLDECFGSENFISQITFKKTSSATDKFLSSTSDYILWYGKDAAQLKYRPLLQSRVAGGEGGEAYNLIEPLPGHWRTMTLDERRIAQRNPADLRILRLQILTSQRQGRDTSIGSAMGYPYAFEGKTYLPSGGRGWTTTQSGMDRLAKAGRIGRSGTTINYKRYFADAPFFPIYNIWDDTQAGSGMDKTYVVQTTTKVVERCLLMTTDPGDLVLDPTCGSGTTAYVAEQWGRRWITIDTSRVALALARTRLMASKYDYYLPRDSVEGATKESELTGKPLPAPNPDHTPDLRQGFVYERAPRVTLKSIANNAEIDVIWDKWQQVLEPLRAKLDATLGKELDEWEIPSEADEAWPESAQQAHAAWWEARQARQNEVDASIARGADVELLYDRPYRARGVVRVAGPFTVESLSPHRVLPLAEDPAFLDPSDNETDPTVVEEAKEQTDFAQVVLEQLKVAGVQNTKKGEAIKFDWLKPFASNRGYVAFEGVYRENGQERRAAVAVGPEYDTVGYDFVKGAAREAATLFDTLIVCGFAFAPEVDDTRLSLGNLNILKARMNQDLRMSDKLKATGASNLFVVFGEPDIRVENIGDEQIKVEIKGVDIFDPTTGEVKSSDDASQDIACWFIDDDYDEESFFVRQAYFLGRDPYENLKRALKADIDEEAWSELNSTESRPFARPQSGKICVKVINHFGDEVQKVFNV
jgi:adenine-specific DNA-methyltransferase